jgi:hypothetical protein
MPEDMGSSSNLAIEITFQGQQSKSPIISVTINDKVGYIILELLKKYIEKNTNCMDEIKTMNECLLNCNNNENRKEIKESENEMRGNI